VSESSFRNLIWLKMIAANDNVKPARAFYNEINPYAAQWLRNLIAGGHIAYGVVDERSIEDIRPEELSEFTQCHFFAGIGRLESRPSPRRMAGRPTSLNGFVSLPAFQRGRQRRRVC
jgi:hypothetical protein